jgi:hypothetical protein
MAKKISQLTQATEVKSDDVTVIVQDGETKKLPLNMMVTKQDIENKKIVGLAKLDEIEATYENDTYTPTITVKNKSSVKTGEGDEVDYSANVMDGHVKSAILLGNTLVNALQEPQDFKIYTESTISYYCRDYKTPTLKANTKYYYKVLNMPTNANWLIGDSSNGTKTYFTYGNANNTSGTITLNDNVVSSTKLWVRFLNGETSTVDILNKIQIIFIEYQDGMENWDIPYFEGMQSVKLPVLTTTGKNIVNEKIWEIETEEEEYQCLLFDGFVTTNSKTENSIIIPVNVKKGKKYTLKCKNKATSYFNYFYLIDDLIDGKVKTNRTRIAENKTLNSFVDTIATFTANGDYKYLHIDTGNTGANGYIVKNTLQLEESSSATTYEPFKSNILTVNEDIELRKVGDVEDTLDCLTGEVVKHVGEVVLDGTNTPNIMFLEPNRAEGYTVFPMQISDVFPNMTANYNNNTQLISNNFNYLVGGYLDRLAGKWMCINAMYFVLSISNDELESFDIQGLNKWLSLNKTTIYYPSEKSIKTVDLMPSGTHPSTTPIRNL